MNLGAFMNPEFPIFSTTLCYLERDDATTNGSAWAESLSGLKARRTACCGK